jgi:hypothetical protein
MDFFATAEKGVASITLAVINSSSKALLKDAKAASVRRGSTVIREVDVKYAISRFQMLGSHKWYLIPVAGNGECQCALSPHP